MPPKLSELRNILTGYLPSATGQADRITKFPGSKAQNTLRVASNVVAGTLVTIGTNVFEVDIINTDAAIDTEGEVANQSTDTTVTFDAAHSFARGDLFRLEDEILKVIRILSTTSVVAARARCGTTAALHATNTDVYKSAQTPDTDAAVDTDAAMTLAGTQIIFDGAHPFRVGDLIKIESEIVQVTKVVSALVVEVERGVRGTTAATHVTNTDVYRSGIPVGLVTTLTPAVFTDALVDEINNAASYERVVGQASSIYGMIVASGPSDNEVLIVATSVGVLTLACTETLAGANNAWAASAMYGGSAAGPKSVLSFPARTPTAVEVALGELKFHCDFTPTKAVVQVNRYGTPLNWDGHLELSAGQVLMDNSGASNDWAATDVVYCVAYE
jgi:hypothetical protein